jgi:hypothetical protein
LEDLRRRIAATNWPEKETMADQSQGVPLAMIQKLARYWMADYDWRKCEARLNALPQFIVHMVGIGPTAWLVPVTSRHGSTRTTPCSCGPFTEPLTGDTSRPAVQQLVLLAGEIAVLVAFVLDTAGDPLGTGRHNLTVLRDLAARLADLAEQACATNHSRHRARAIAGATRRRRSRRRAGPAT